MRLIDLHPVFPSTGGEGVSDASGNPIPVTEGVGVIFDCPCGNADEEHRCFVPFANPIGPGPYVPQAGKGWTREGETFETLTLRPSIQRISECCWHGHITSGEVTS